MSLYTVAPVGDEKDTVSEPVPTLPHQLVFAEKLCPYPSDRSQNCAYTSTYP